MKTRIFVEPTTSVSQLIDLSVSAVKKIAKLKNIKGMVDVKFQRDFETDNKEYEMVIHITLFDGLEDNATVNLYQFYEYERNVKMLNDALELIKKNDITAFRLIR